MATYSAQNWGAGKIKRIRSGVVIAGLTSLVISILMSLAVRYVGEDMISVFLKEDNPFIIATGKMYLSISTLFYFFLGMIFIFRNTLQGMGKALIPLIACVIELGARSFSAIYLAHAIGYKGIFYASPIAWLGAGVVVMIGYIITIRGLKAQKLKNYFKNYGPAIRVKAAINTVNQSPAE